MNRRVKRWHLLLMIGSVLVLMIATPVLAHSNLVRSIPEANASLQNAPTEIRLWFTEPVEPDYSGFSLRDSSGDLVATSPSQVDSADPHQMFMEPGALSDGLYTVVWHAVSASDGHFTNGSFAFGIGVAVANNPASSIDESVAPDGVLIRWLNLIGLSLLVGSIGFWLFVGHAAALQDRAVMRQRWRQLTWFGWIVVGVSTLLILLLQVSTDASISLFAALTSPALGNVLAHTAFGQLLFARFVLWGLLGLVLWISARRERTLWIALLLSALLLVVQSLYSHASAAPDRAALASDWLHLVSSSLWIGGLAAFALALWTLRQEADRTTLSERLVAAFSNFARVAIALLVITGLYAAWLEIGSFDALLHTLYGQALLAKGVLFLPLLALAATNLLLTQRGLKRGETRWVGRLRGSVGAEIVLTVGVLLTVSVMASGNPAREVQALREAAAAPSQSQPYFDMETVNNQMMHLQIIPGYVGQNQFIVTPYDTHAKPITNASLIRLRFTNLDQNLGESELRPQPDGNGNYTVTGANLSIPGHWRIRMTLEQPGQFDIVVDFNAAIELPPPTPSIEAITAIPISQRALAAAITGIALLGIGGFFVTQERRRLRSAAGMLTVSSILLGLVFLVQAAQRLALNPPTSPPIVNTVTATAVSTGEAGPLNPVEADAASINAGQTLFTQNCVICHGVDGKGDGPVGLTLNPRPADLTVHTVAGLHTDGQLYEWITNGFPHSAMPAFGQRLSNTDRWNLVNYIRTLARTQ